MYVVLPNYTKKTFNNMAGPSGAMKSAAKTVCFEWCGVGGNTYFLFFPVLDKSLR